MSKLRGRTAFREFAGTTRALLIAVSPGKQLSYGATRMISGAVVAAEISVVALLVVPGASRFGIALAVLLLAAFGFGIAAAMRRGVRTSCRCFGSSSTPLGARHLIRNAGLILVAVGGVIAGPVGAADPARLALAGGAAAILALLVVRLDELIDLFTPTLEIGRTR